MLVTFLVLAVLAGMLLRALTVAQQGVEHTLVTVEVMSLRTELQLAVASEINRGREGQLSGWVAGNPLVLAGRGENAPAASGDASLQLRHHWRWDDRKKVLVYEFADGEHLLLRIARASGLEHGGWALGGGLLLVQEKKAEERANRP